VCQERAIVIAPVAVNAPSEDWPGADAAHESRSIKAVEESIRELRSAEDLDPIAFQTHALLSTAVPGTAEVA